MAGEFIFHDNTEIFLGALAAQLEDAAYEAEDVLIVWLS